MPDLNLPPLLISEVYIDGIRSNMPEATRSRLLGQGLSARDTELLMFVDSGREAGFDGEPGSGGPVAYFDSLSEGREAKVVVHWMTHELFGQLNAESGISGTNG